MAVKRGHNNPNYIIRNYKVSDLLVEFGMVYNFQHFH